MTSIWVIMTALVRGDWVSSSLGLRDSIVWWGKLIENPRASKKMVRDVEGWGKAVTGMSTSVFYHSDAHIQRLDVRECFHLGLRSRNGWTKAHTFMHWMCASKIPKFCNFWGQTSVGTNGIQAFHSKFWTCTNVYIRVRSYFGCTWTCASGYSNIWMFASEWQKTDGESNRKKKLGGVGKI